MPGRCPPRWLVLIGLGDPRQHVARRERPHRAPMGWRRAGSAASGVGRGPVLGDLAVDDAEEALDAHWAFLPVAGWPMNGRRWSRGRSRTWRRGRLRRASTRCRNGGRERRPEHAEDPRPRRGDLALRADGCGRPSRGRDLRMTSKFPPSMTSSTNRRYVASFGIFAGMSLPFIPASRQLLAAAAAAAAGTMAPIVVRSPACRAVPALHDLAVHHPVDPDGLDADLLAGRGRAMNSPRCVPSRRVGRSPCRRWP